MRVHSIEAGSRHDGYRSHAIGAPAGHTKEGEHAGYESSSVSAKSGHPYKGGDAANISHKESGGSKDHVIFNGIVSGLRDRVVESIVPTEFDTVSYPTFVTLSIATCILPPSTLTAAVIVGMNFPQSPLLGAAEATALAAGAVGSFLVSKKFIRAEL